MTRVDQDLERPLRLAIRSTRLLGGVSAAYGIFFVFAYGYFNRFERWQVFFIAVGMALWVLPGVLLLINSYQLQQRRRFAAITSMIAAIAQGLCALAIFIVQFRLTPLSPIP